MTIKIEMDLMLDFRNEQTCAKSDYNKGTNL
jgi:hypothetical protein